MKNNVHRCLYSIIVFVNLNYNLRNIFRHDSISWTQVISKKYSLQIELHSTYSNSVVNYILHGFMDSKIRQLAVKHTKH